MTLERGAMGAAALLVASAAAASQPCNLPQVGLAPGMNSTNVSEPVKYYGAYTSLWVEAEDGSPVAVTIDRDGGNYGGPTLLSGFGPPGWYTVHSGAMPPGHESSDRSMVPNQSDFWADVLVGRSEPGIARLEQCSSSVVVRWSEPVTFEVDPMRDLELLDADGQALACVDRIGQFPGGYDGGGVNLLSLACDGGYVAALRVVRAQRGIDGGVGTFPPVGETFALTTWAYDGWSISYPERGCRIWQPRMRLQTHENVSPNDVQATYAKCGNSSGCGCGATSRAEAFGGVTFLLLAWRRRGRAR